MENEFFRKWIRASLFSLFIVAFLGCMMRYKIAYSLPWLPQKNVLNAHSHFAFAGWLTQVLMVLMVQYLWRRQNTISLKKYNILLWANMLSAYGMVLSFPWEGYGLVSIIFSTLSVLVSYVFAVVYWRDLNRLPDKSVTHNWFKAAVLFNALSSVGVFALTFMMAGHIQHEHWYLSAIYFYLHFQYNGWFFFACTGLLYSRNEGTGSTTRYIFWLFALACVPAYMLSILWAHLPPGAYSLTALAALMQLVGWAALVSQVHKKRIVLLEDATKTARILFIFAAIAGTAKFLLQTGSLHPGLAKLAFGFRPIVIGYLHLVLLGLITIFILAYLKRTGFIAVGGIRKSGIIIFVSGIILQEALLMFQGVMAITYHTVPFINEALFASALVMLVGIAMLNAGMRKTDVNTQTTLNR